jgi:hypothetical protein
MAEVALALAGREVDDLADVLLAEVDEPRRRGHRVGARGADEALAQPSGHRCPAASTIFLNPSAHARFWASLPALKVSDW